MNNVVDFLARVSISVSRLNSSQGKELNKSDKKVQKVISPFFDADGKEQYIRFESGSVVSCGAPGVDASK